MINEGPGYRDTATCLANYARFVSRVGQNEVVWGLKGTDGWAFAESNDNPNISIILFWSDEAYARRACSSFPEKEPERIELFNFLYRWLPGMSGDGVLAGANWTGDLVGLESDPYELRSEIEDHMSFEQNLRYQARYKREKALGK